MPNIEICQSYLFIRGNLLFKIASLISFDYQNKRIDIPTSESGLNGKEDWPWDPTDEMNFQWKSRIESR